jgi:signal transduction histidine kinase
MATVVQEVYQVFISRAEGAGVHLEYSIDTSYASVLGDEDRLRRMLYNLVDNAIKYTPYGGRVNLSMQDGELENTILLTVVDTGFGIAEAQLPHVFERFYRVEATRPRYGPPQGSGLGLSIAKSIAENHGGKISVTSQVGKGSTFIIELPAQRAM